MRLPVSILFFWLPAVALAASGDGSVSQPLDTARRDLQAMQAGQESGLVNADAGKSTFGVSAAVTPLETDEPALKTVTLAAPKAKEDKSHWLLDAMDAQKNDSSKLPSGDKSGDGGQSILLSTPNAGGEKADSELKPPPPAVVNPLAPFLNQWMTPQDYTLLARPAADGGLAPASAPTVDSPGGIIGEGTGATGPDLPATANEARPNLYLSGITDFSAGAVAPPPAIAPVAPPAPVASGAAPAESPSATPPPFASPDDTAKYFPQLKNHF